MNHPVNYYAGIEFELTAYQREFGGVYKDLTGSWEKKLIRNYLNPSISDLL